MTPFARLCNGESIPTNRYWQAMTLVDMLLSHEDYRNRLPKMMAAIQESRSTNLEPILQPVLGKTWQELTDDWRDHCRQKY